MSRHERQNPWRIALDQALMQLSQAEHAFEWSEAAFCDYHAYRIQAAKEQVALILRQARQAYGVESVDRMLRESPLPSALTSGEFAQSRW